MPDKDALFEITLSTDELDSYRVRASHVSEDERIFPGWTLLKDSNGTIAAMVRKDKVFLIRRLDDPAQLPAPSPVPSPVPATPAMLAQLAASR
jgi:hypothetical protein